MHRLEQFKGFADAEVNLFRPLTVLIGPNGVGKSNLIEAMELISYVASGQAVHAITDVGRSGSLEIRGGLQACARRPATTFTLSFRAKMNFDGVGTNFVYSVTLRAVPAQEIERETLTAGDRVIFDASRQQPGLLEVSYDNFNRGGNKPTHSVSSSLSVLTQYAAFASSNKKFDQCLEFIQRLQGYLARSYVFDPHPRLMRDYDRVGNTVLQRDGANLSAVLHGLHVGSAESRAALLRIVERIRQVPEESFTDVGFETTKLNDVIFGLKRDDGTLVDARLLSDGTLRALAVLTALETCPPTSRLVIEEFDNGIHPSRVRLLFEAVMEAAKRRQINVLVTTHNPATLDGLPSEALSGVVVAHWDPTARSSRLTALLDLPGVDELLERGRLGDLVTRKIVESYLAPVSDAQRQDQVRAWLEALP